MKVLIAEFDLFHNIGGGQTFYRRLIETNPHIEFYYLIIEEKKDNIRPHNVKVISYQQFYLKSDLQGFKTNISIDKIYRSFLFASNIAYSLKGYNFDIIDYPDYQQYGLFLASAFQYHQVNFEKIVISLHGIVSESLSHDWGENHEYINNLKFVEDLQYQIADIRYGISKNYLEYWQEKSEFPNYYFHPLHFLNLTPKLNYQISQSKPSLNFIGRKEKGKGVDIFVNLVNFLPKNIYREVNIIGSNPDTLDGKTGEFYLQQMLDFRLMKVNIFPSVNHDKLQQIFNHNGITFLPSRFDTLNLVALESLFSGCPTIISKNAGVCRFLEDNYSSIPFVKLDIDNYHLNLPQIIDIIENYQDYRLHLQDKIKQVSSPLKKSDLSLLDIYHQPSNFDEEIREKSQQWYQELINYCQGKQYLGKPQFVNLTKKIVTPTKDKITTLKTNLKQQKNPITNQLIKGLFFEKAWERVTALPEISASEIDIKIEELKVLSHPLKIESIKKVNKLESGYYLNRLKIWREIARLERIRGNHLLSATYEIRVIRLLGEDKFNQLESIQQTLINHNFASEAEALNLLYASPNSSQLIYEYLTNNYQNLLNYQEKPYEFLTDYRSKKNYRVSIVISLYNAESKLARFLSILAQQTIIQKQEAEIILIDSGSPQQEYKVFQAIQSELNLPIIYARSKERETIQSAWNRGILLCQSPYLTFLGVDEMITADGIEILADKLDGDDNLDWVVGNSLVTEVDENGHWLRDIMTYNRDNFHQDLVYLDTCYLTYVGGLYRRNLHSRFGFYDENFRGAGDTEFKNRVLPHIHCGFVNHLLGIFWNYPDDRTTQSPLTEIEDLKAWYLYRSLGGLKYAFDNKDTGRIEKLLLHCLNYRKSFLTNQSTDIDLAYQLILWLAENNPNSSFLQLREGIDKIRQIYQKLEYFNDKKPYFWQLWDNKQLFNKINRIHQEILASLTGENILLPYYIFNDNKYQQHHLLW